MAKRLALLAIMMVCLLCGSTPASAQLISLWADSNMYAHNVYPGMGGTFDMYIFVEPDARGIFGVEFSIVYPSAAIFITPPGTPVWNPAADIAVSLGDFFIDGISLGFSSCINAPIWIAKYNFICFEMAPVFIELDVAATGDPPVIQDHMNAMICDEAHTKVEAFALNWFGVNTGLVPPILKSVEATSPITVFAEFNQNVMPWDSPFYDSHFIIYKKLSPQDTIKVLKAYQEQAGDPFFALVLESAMVPGTDYILAANDICYLCGECASSTMEFHYDGNFEDRPDLWAIDMTSATFSPSACDPFQVGYSIFNIGALPSGPFSVRGILVYSPEGVSINETIFMNEYSGLEAGMTITDSLLISIPDHTRHRTLLGIHVDYYDEVDEWTIYNNFKTLDFANYSPAILAIDDLPQDTGGWVTLHFLRSLYEILNEGISVRYDVVHRIDDSSSWELVEQIPGARTTFYQCNVPTAADSGDGGQHNWSVYKVILVTPDGSPSEDIQMYSSCPDSGYSLDNTVSTLLQEHAATLTESRILLTWRLSADGFGGRFAIDRSEDEAGFLRIDDPDIKVDGTEYSFIDDTVIPGRNYRYRVGYIEDGSSRILFETGMMQIPEAVLALYQNSPNPFNPSTTISWFLPGAMHVRLEIFDVSGRPVRLLVDEELESGQHSIIWDGRGENGSAVSSGIYFLRLSAGKESITRKMVLLK